MEECVTRATGSVGREVRWARWENKMSNVSNTDLRQCHIMSHFSHVRAGSECAGEAGSADCVGLNVSAQVGLS